jgi:hypothetical protein
VSASTITVGYPVHRLATFSPWADGSFTDWTAACGASGYVNGRATPRSGRFGTAGSARRAELCPTCFPGREMRGHWPDPVEVPRP